MNSQKNKLKTSWLNYRKDVLLIFVGGGMDTIGFIALFGFFTNHVTGNFVMAGASWFEGDNNDVWIKLAAIPIFIITVAVTKLYIDYKMKQSNKHLVISQLFIAEAILLFSFMILGLWFTPFEHSDSISVAITAYVGLMALAIRNTSGKTLMDKFNPGTVMTGTTTGLGVNITNFIKNRTKENQQKLLHSFISVLTFLFGAFLGAFLYKKIGFWSVSFFIPSVLGLAYLSRKKLFFT